MELVATIWNFVKAAQHFGSCAFQHVGLDCAL